MANTDWAFGFQPWQNLRCANYFSVITAPTIAIYHGDMVGAEAAFTQTPAMGYLMSIYDAGSIDGKDNILGAVLGIFDENFEPVNYIAATEAGNGTIAGYVLVADDPGQFFVGREDFDTNAIDITEGADNANIVTPSPAGDTNTGISNQMIDSDSADVTAALNLKLYTPHPNDVNLVADDTPGSSNDEGARYICKVTEHYYGMPSADGGQAA